MQQLSFHQNGLGKILQYSDWLYLEATSPLLIWCKQNEISLQFILYPLGTGSKSDLIAKMSNFLHNKHIFAAWFNPQRLFAWWRIVKRQHVLSAYWLNAAFISDVTTIMAFETISYAAYGRWLKIWMLWKAVTSVRLVLGCCHNITVARKHVYHH